MKENEMKKLAFLGMTAGLLLMNQPSAQALEDSHLINLDYVIAKPSCKAHGGCSGLTASRDRNEESGSLEENDEDEVQQDTKKKLQA